jgi:hypothetical protein
MPLTLRLVDIPIGPSIAYVPLTHGQWAIIDREDAPLAGKYNWCAWWDYRRKVYYAIRTLNGQRPCVMRMHRLIAGIVDNPDACADHKNLNTLDNRRANLRLATKDQNAANRRKPAHNTSGYKGVSWHKHRKKWQAYIGVRGGLKSLGYFDSAELAYAAYCAAAPDIHGEFARLA